MDIIDRKYNELDNKFIKLFDKNDNDKYNYRIYNILCKEYKTYDVILYFYYKLKIYILENKEYTQNRDNTKQQKLRKNCIERDKVCIISGSNSIQCDTAHIIPLNICNSEEAYDINNTILLRTDIHRLFDNYLFSIDENSCIVLSNKVLTNREEFNNIYKYNNTCLKTKLNKEQKEYLKIYYQKFKEKNF